MRKPNPFPLLSSVRKRFFDNFQRADTEQGLGFTSTGSLWDIVRGNFRILANFAYSPPEDPEDYPIASVTMPYENVQVSMSAIDVGSGAALWVTDSGNWWGLGLEEEEVDCNCSFDTQCDRWNQGGLCDRWNVGNCNRWNTRNCRSEQCAEWACSSFNAGNCNGWEFAGVSGPFPFFRCNSWNTRNCSSNVCVRNECTRWNAGNCNRWNSRNCNRWTVETCSEWSEFAFDCQKCYPRWIRIIQSANTTITTAARFLITKTFTIGSSPFGSLPDFRQTSFLNKLIQSMKVYIKGKNIEADLFHETNFVDKVDVEEEIVYSATGATVTTSYGIMIFPSESGQSTFIGPIQIDKN